MPPPVTHASRWIALAGAAATLALAWVFAGWTGPDQLSADVSMMWTLVTALPWALLWLAAAAGFGTWIRRWLAPTTKPARLVALALGTATLLWLDTTLGRLGLLTPITAWTLLAIGIAALIAALRGHRASPRPQAPGLFAPSLFFFASAPALAVLLVAACSTPGWLWSTEHGGFDALAYHLLLPREWMATGRIEGLPHNVYAFLPGYVEAAYMHLGVLRGDALVAASSAQMLHATITVLTALGIGALAADAASERARPLVGGAAAAIFIVTPWNIIVGSLAYNEMFVSLMLVAGIAVLRDDKAFCPRRGWVIGILAAGACGAKLTSIGFVAVPLGVLLVVGRPWPPRVVALGAAAAAGVIGLLPWLAGNGIATGNPVFPFLTEWLGAGHWSAEQAATWSSAHMGSGRPGALWDQWLGWSPSRVNAWQWSLLPWLGIAGIGLAATHAGRPRRRAIQLGVVLVVQVVFWMFATHQQARFLLPTAVPLALGLGLGLATILGERTPVRLVMTVVAIPLVALSLLPSQAFRRERDGQPAAMIDWIGLRTGRDIPADRRAGMAAIFPDLFVRFELPRDARVLLVGESAPLYYPDNVVYQSTWDRGPLSDAMRESNDPAAWMAALRDAGFTHLLVRPEMLTRWADAGWNDPLLTTQRVLDATNTHAEILAEFPAGVTVYRIR